MTDATLTPEIYGDFGLFLDQMGVRPKRPRSEEQAPPKPVIDRTYETNEWYKQGKECPF